MIAAVEREIDVLHVSPERFRIVPQIGVPCRMTWTEFSTYLARPSMGESKDCAGAWSAARYTDNVRRKANLVEIHALVIDVDENGDVDQAAELVAANECILHETFSSTDAAPRCRIVMLLAEPLAASEYEAAHKIVRSHLAAAGMPADEGAKDASRLSYSPVRRAGTGYRFRTTHGVPLDARAMIAAQPVAPPRPFVPPPAPEHRDGYIRAALHRASDAVARASAGTRHYHLCKEAFALARLGLADVEIEHALLPAFIAAAGEARAGEAMRSIRDAARARRGAA